VQIDWLFLEAVNWAEVAWVSGIAFLAALVGNVLISKHWFGATTLAMVLFAAAPATASIRSRKPRGSRHPIFPPVISLPISLPS